MLGLSLAVGGHLLCSCPTGKGLPPGRGRSAQAKWGGLQACPYLPVGRPCGRSGQGEQRGKVSWHLVPPCGLKRRDVLRPGHYSEERSCCAGLAGPAGREGTLCPQGILSAAPVVSVGCTLGPAARRDG